METGEDIGQRAVQKIHKHLMIDEPWTLRAERGFLRLGHRLKIDHELVKVERRVKHETTLCMRYPREAVFNRVLLCEGNATWNPHGPPRSIPSSRTTCDSPVSAPPSTRNRYDEALMEYAREAYLEFRRSNAEGRPSLKDVIDRFEVAYKADLR